MAKAVTFLMILSFIAMILSLASADFESFKKDFKKSYSSRENNRRKAIFQSNLAQIDKLNKVSAKDASAAKFGVNSLSDMDASEFKLTRLGLPTPSTWDILKSRVVGNSNQQPALTATTNYPLDGTFNWDNQSVVTAVKNQGSCGSCWIFAAVSIIETYYARKTGKLTSLSEQQMLDCKLRASPCNGGWPTEVFYYAKVNGTVATTSNPYKAVPASTCKSATMVTKILSYARVTNQNSEQQIINALRTYGTIVMCLNANVLQSYKSGIVTKAQCSSGAPNHAVTLVGYGIESGKKFWRFRNSWGATWGEKGYFRIERNTNACDLQNSYSGYGPWYIAS